MMFYSNTIPVDYLLCDGSSFSSSTYPLLFALLGGTTLPDLRGKFIRGKYGSRVIGDQEEESIGNHTHEVDLTTNTID